MRRILVAAPAAITTGLLFAGPALAQESAANLAMKLSNPIAAPISVPLQLNYDQNIGLADEGDKCCSTCSRWYRSRSARIGT
jgi:hypothetical protein